MVGSGILSNAAPLEGRTEGRRSAFLLVSPLACPEPACGEFACGELVEPVEPACGEPAESVEGLQVSLQETVAFVWTMGPPMGETNATFAFSVSRCLCGKSSF